jgi:2-polyprenyl-6-methoxyphenol hydroxylase-like FAD-dependent oxidoreductase
MHDAIVAGARCAGASAAMLLARKGYRVWLLAKASFPSDTLSTDYIHRPGVVRLKRWGLLDKIVASNCPPARQLRFDVGPFAPVGTPRRRTVSAMPTPHDGRSSIPSWLRRRWRLGRSYANTSQSKSC